MFAEKHWLIWTFLYQIFVNYVASVQYWNSFEQYNTTISETSVQCLGYESCAYSSIESTSSYLHCFSSRSCIGSKYIIAESDADFQGYLGGAFAGIIIDEKPADPVVCDHYSCIGTTIFLKSAHGSDTDSSIDCRGSHSCMHSLLKTKDDVTSNDPSEIYFRGAWSGYNTTIIANSSFDSNAYFSNINVTLDGWYSGYGLDIECRDNSSCHVCTVAFIHICFVVRDKKTIYSSLFVEKFLLESRLFFFCWFFFVMFCCLFDRLFVVAMGVITHK